MSEQTLSEALSDIDVDLNISDKDIESAAVPEYARKSNDEVQEESTYVELSDEELAEISPATEDVVEETLPLAIENCKRFNTQSNCKIRTESFQTSINKPALIQRPKIYRYKKVILKSFKAGLRRKLILPKETFRRLTNLEIPKLWQKLNSLLPEPKLTEVL